MRVIKRNKFWFYVKGYANFFLPVIEKGEQKINKILSKLSQKEVLEVEKRVNYYCKLPIAQYLSNKNFIKDLKKPKTPKSYYFDTYEYARFFDENSLIDFIFGDVVDIPKTPSIVKSRPIVENNQNSVLLNLDKIRHFVWIENDKPFAQKRDMLIGRCAIYQQNRIDFFQKYFGHRLCDLGQVNDNGGNKIWKKPKMSVKQHLDYKFILSLQGNDVATNLKWIMSSNSIAVMPKPTMETWFMEGQLIAGKHYIEIKPDYSDLEEQLDFYINNPDKCLEIINNAHHHCAIFHRQDIEDLCSLLVLRRYLFGL